MSTITPAASKAHSKPIIRAEGEGERLSFYGGGTITLKATAAETNGAFLLFEDQVVRGKTTPLHIHPHEDEMLYIVEGELLVHYGSPSITAANTA